MPEIPKTEFPKCEPTGNLQTIPLKRALMDINAKLARILFLLESQSKTNADTKKSAK